MVLHRHHSKIDLNVCLSSPKMTSPQTRSIVARIPCHSHRYTHYKHIILMNQLKSTPFKTPPTYRPPYNSPLRRHATIYLRKLTTSSNHNRSLRLTTLWSNTLHGPNDIQTLHNLTKDTMLSIQPGCFGSAKEELCLFVCFDVLV